MHKSPVSNDTIKHLIFDIKSRIYEKVWDLQQAKPNNQPINTEQMVEKLEDQIWKYITTKNVDGRSTYKHLLTWSHSKTTHYLLTQKTAALAYFNMYELKKDNKYLELAINIIDYILANQEPTGIFLMHNHPYLAQDEGPTTAGIIKALLVAYNYTKKNKYLEAAIRAGEGSRNRIYDEKHGYIHTLGQDYWCTNINSSFAYSYLFLYKYTDDERFLNWGCDGIKFTLKGQDKSGLFLYSSKLKHIFRALYQALILLTLMEINDIKRDKKIDRAIKIGIDYAYSMQREDGSIKEPEMNCYAFLQSCTRFAHLFNMIGDTKRFNKLENFISKFFVKNRIYLEVTPRGILRYGFRKRYIEANYVRMFEDLTNVMLNKKYKYWQEKN